MVETANSLSISWNINSETGSLSKVTLSFFDYPAKEQDDNIKPERKPLPSN